MVQINVSLIALSYFRVSTVYCCFPRSGSRKLRICCIVTALDTGVQLQTRISRDCELPLHSRSKTSNNTGYRRLHQSVQRYFSVPQGRVRHFGHFAAQIHLQDALPLYIQATDRDHIFISFCINI